MNKFKPTLKDVRKFQRFANPDDIEKTYQKNTETSRAIRSKLERSASSVRKAREELCNEMQFNVQKVAIDEGLMVLNRDYE